MADCKKYNGSTWQHSLRKLGTSTDTITTLPADLYADGNNATVGLVGNMFQSGIPTPQNPIQPQECGDRTGNLWNEDYTGISSSLKYVPVYVGDGTFTMSTDTPDNSRNASLFLLSGNVTSGASTPINGVYNDVSRTEDSSNGYITIAFRRQNESSDPTTHKTMLNLGETALSYEPYGYKIPISSANTITNVYLGEVETTRQIKKLVLTGEETGWTKNADVSESNAYYRSVSDYYRYNGLCSHYAIVDNVRSETGVFFGSNINFLTTLSDEIDTVDKWKSYLATQYAAGTPVTVWYVLATETTGIVNEPLRKIGDYADTVSGIAIPTITGKDTFDVQTTLKPSEVFLNYTGWHDAEVKEWDGSEWKGEDAPTLLSFSRPEPTEESEQEEPEQEVEDEQSI